MYALDKSEKIVIAGPMSIGEADTITKYRAESDGRTFWAFNGCEVWRPDERGYHWLDEIWRLRNLMADREYEALQSGMHSKRPLYDSEGAWQDYVNDRDDKQTP